MASTKECLMYVLELINIEGITYKKMMGEYLLYKNGVLFGGIYDNRFLIKKTTSVSNCNLKEEIPYEGAKPMLLIDSEDSEEIKSMIIRVCDDLTIR